MYLSFVKNNIVPRDVYEFFGSIILVILVIFTGSFISNIITKLYLKKTEHIIYKSKIITLILLLFFHILIIFCFIILLRYILNNVIKNPLILGSSTNFIGPTIAASSLYFSQTLKDLISILQ